MVFATYNRPAKVDALLSALASQEYPRDSFEVIAVQDGDRCPLDEIVARREADLNLTLVRTARRGPAGARQAGIDQARGWAVALLDDDCAPAPDWLWMLDRALLNLDCRCAVGGFTVNALRRNVYSEASQILVSYLYESLNVDPNHAQFFTTSNMVVPLAPLREMGGFDAGWPFAGGEDRDLCDRWIASGGRLVSVPDALVYHYHDMTFRSFLRQQFNYGLGSCEFHRARGRQSRRARPMGAKFYTGLFRYAWKNAQPHQRTFVGLLMAASQAASLTGYAFRALGRAFPSVVASAAIDPATARARIARI